MPNNFDYNRDVPDGPNNPSDDQPDMKINTNSIDDLLAVNHISFETDGGGIHKFVQIPIPDPVQSPGVGDGDGVLFGLPLTVGSDTFLWPAWQNKQFAGGAPGGASTFLFTGVTTATANGSTFVTGGIEIKWGSVTPAANGSGDGTITFSAAFRNNCFSVMLTPLLATTTIGFSVCLKTISTSGCTYKITPIPSALTAMYYIAIGN